MFQLELTDPLLLAGLLGLLFLAYSFRFSLVDYPRWQRLWSLSCRLLIVALLVLAVSGLTLLQQTSRQFVVFAVDESLSIGEDSRQAVEAFVSQATAAASGHQVAFVDFAVQPSPVYTDRSQPPLKRDREASLGTDLAAAIEVAAAAIPPSSVPHIVLLTDGNATSGDTLAAAMSCQAMISTVPLQSRADPEVRVAEVGAPAQVPRGEPFELQVAIDSNRDTRGLVEVFRGGIKRHSEPRAVPKGVTDLQFKQEPLEDRLTTFTVTLREFPDDTIVDNNTASALVFASTKPRVLLVESDPLKVRSLASALEEEGIDVELRPAQGVPQSLADLQNYELLILSDVPATDLTKQQMDVVRTYVQYLGGGLMMLGGDQSFGLGGYYKTVIEEILPVASNFEKEKEKPSLGMIPVIDRSGSMQGQKIELAKEAAKSAVELIGPKDQIGLIAFDSGFHVVSELRPYADRQYLLDRVSSLEAGGGTVIGPALQEAQRQLQGSASKLKHIILLSDGVSSDGSSLLGLVESLASEGITVSTVALGEQADRALLESMATLGGGRYYPVDDPTRVPQVFAKETVTVSQAALEEEPFLPVALGRNPVLTGVDLDAAPLLLGYVKTIPKPTSEVVLWTEQGDPLLVWWRYGLGMAVAFTSDAKSRWASEWITWQDYSRFWVQVVRHAMRNSDAKGIVTKLESGAYHTEVTVDAMATTGHFLNDAESELTVIGPELDRRQLKMTQTVPGRYVGRFETQQPGPYHMEIALRRGDKEVHRQSRGMVVGYPDELRLKPVNEDLLQTVSRATGGVYDIKPQAVFDSRGRVALRPLPLWPYLTMAAALVFLLDVALRRVDMSWLTEQAGARFRLRRPRRAS